MTFSLNEIETMGKRAARGAGLDWGLAEEAGKAARWLAAHGLPGPELLAALLARNEGRSYDDLAPAATEGVWHAPSGWLCPLIAGAALSDRAAALAAGRDVDLGSTAFPLLLAPYAAAVARTAGVALELVWTGASLTVSPEDGLTAEGPALTADSAASVHCRLAGARLAAGPAVPPHPTVDTEAWGRLDAFAQRSFAPATEASRMAGAGAGVIDTD